MFWQKGIDIRNGSTVHSTVEAGHTHFVLPQIIVGEEKGFFRAWNHVSQVEKRESLSLFERLMWREDWPRTVCHFVINSFHRVRPAMHEVQHRDLLLKWRKNVMSSKEEDQERWPSL